MIEPSLAVNLSAIAKREEKNGSVELAGILRLTASAVHDGCAEIERLTAEVERLKRTIDLCSGSCSYQQSTVKEES